MSVHRVKLLFLFALIAFAPVLGCESKSDDEGGSAESAEGESGEESGTANEAEAEEGGDEAEPEAETEAEPADDVLAPIATVGKGRTESMTWVQVNDAPHVAVAKLAGATILNPESGDTVAEIGDERPGMMRLAGTADGTLYVATSRAKKEVYAFDAATGEESAVVAFDQLGTVKAIAARGDGQRIVAVGPNNGRALLIDPSGETAPVEIDRTTDDYFRAAAFSPDGSVLALAQGKQLRLFDGTTGESLRDLDGHSDLIGTIRFSGDGARIATVSSQSKDALMHVWDTASGDEVATLEGAYGRPFPAIALDADGKRVLVGENLALVLLDVASGEELERWKIKGIPWEMASDAAREQVAIGGNAGQIWTVTLPAP